jgi:large subunit ribosomal protein L29
MKAEDIRDMTDEQIVDRVRELEEERFRLRFRSAIQELENPTLLRTLKRDIARLKTIARERQIAQQGG